MLCSLIVLQTSNLNANVNLLHNWAKPSKSRVESECNIHDYYGLLWSWPHNVLWYDASTTTISIWNINNNKVIFTHCSFVHASSITEVLCHQLPIILQNNCPPIYEEVSTLSICAQTLLEMSNVFALHCIQLNTKYIEPPGMTGRFCR